MKTGTYLASCLLAALALVALEPSALAQSNVAVVRGVVEDPNGAAIAGATVTLTNAVAHYAQTTHADAAGAYELVDVPRGRYALAAEAPGFERLERVVVVESGLARLVDLRLGVAGVKQEESVRAEGALLEPDRTGPSYVVDRSRILTFPAAQPSRSTEWIVATAPGWTLDANGRLHARGLEYQVLYSIDGVPVTDTIAATFASAPDPRTFRSVEISTANIPAEYGNKLAGVVNVTSQSGLELPTSGSATLSGGSFNTVEGAFDFGGHTGKTGYFVSAAGGRTDRFLDPPTLDNLHNRGDSAKAFFKFDYAPHDSDLVRLALSFGREEFDVPNLPDQHAEGQDQRRHTRDLMASLTWEHTFSPSVVGYLSAFERYNGADLDSNLLGGPVIAEQSRHHQNYGALGSVTFERGRHIVKAGFEAERFPLSESFTLGFTDVDEIVEKEPDLPEDVRDFTPAAPFFFSESRAGWEGSLYVQDHVSATRNLVFDLGLRYDSYHFLVEENAVSPRLGVAYYIPRSKTVLRASFNRFLETPALENLLLSSSEEARIFSPGDEEGEEGEEGDRRREDDEEEPGEDERSAPVEPSDEWQVDFGFEQQLSDYVRVSADFYYRRLSRPPEIANFLETGIIFPANLDRSRSKGVETRLDLAPFHGVTGYASYTNLHIYGFFPIIGGLFLGEAIDSHEKAGQRVNIEEDQRNTLDFEARYDYAPWRAWAALHGRHDSGFSVELEEERMREDFEEEFPEEILERVNFERGFVEPHTVLDFSAGKAIEVSEHLTLMAQFNVLNLTNTFYPITFESVFSGTALGAPRTYSGSVSFNFR